MADLNMPNLNKKSDKYLFKNKLSIRRKSKRKLLNESFLMFFLSGFLALVNYLIPNKKILFSDFLYNLEESYSLSINLLTYLYRLSLVFFMFISIVLFIILILGIIYRLNKVLSRKTKQISYK